METPETRAKLADAIRKLKKNGDEATIKKLVGAYKTKYKKTEETVPQAPQSSNLKKVFTGGDIAPTFPAKEGGISTIPGNVARTFGNIPSSAAKIAQSVIAPVNPLNLQSPMNIGSSVVKGIDTARDIIKDRGVVQGGKDIASGFGSTIKKIGGAAVDFVEKTIENPGQTVSDLTKVGIENPLLIPSIIYTPSKALGQRPDAISRVASVATRGKDTSLTNIAKQLTQKSEKQIEKAVVKSFEKGVKPLLPGRTTLSKATDYKEDIVNAVKTINQNKPNLKFTDEIGDVVTSRNPKSLQEFSDAIEQTKGAVYRQYDDLARRAGEEGLKIKVSEIGDELNTVINSKALQLTNPKAIKYAEELKDRLVATGQIDAKTTQEVIQHYNKSLDAFYRNPNYDTASQAAIDAMVANRIRKSLDEGITGLTGESYKALKNQYGALKTIEKDVVKATLRDARKNAKGLLDYTDILTGGDIIGGIMTLSPTAIARGVTARGIKEFYKFLNDPNRAISKMFDLIEN